MLPRFFLRIPVALAAIVVCLLLVDLNRGQRSAARPYLPTFTPHASWLWRSKHQLDALRARYESATRSYWTFSDGDLDADALLVSSNGRYSFGRTPSGEFAVHALSETRSPRALWWSNDGAAYQGTRRARVTERGAFVNRHRFPQPLEDGQATVETFSTAQIPACGQPTLEPGSQAVLHLTDWGALRMSHVATADVGALARLHTLDDADGAALLRTVCDVFEGERNVRYGTNMGRLAVVLAGSLAALHAGDQCETLRTRIFDEWPGRDGVDVFVATAEKDWDWAKAERRLRQCFGDMVRKVEHKSPPSVPAARWEKLQGECSKGRLTPQEILNTEYTVYRGFQMVLDYMMRHHISYDYVLKMRPDHWVWGDELPPFEPLDVDTLLMPKPYFEHVQFFGTHLNTSHQAPSDQIAFGRFLPMSVYLSLYNSYETLLPAAQANNDDGRVMYQSCGFDARAPCPNKAEQYPCWMEGLAGYWTKLNGLKMKIDYRWKVSVVTKSGDKEQPPRYPWNLEQGSKLVETADD